MELLMPENEKEDQEKVSVATEKLRRKKKLHRVATVEKMFC